MVEFRRSAICWVLPALILLAGCGGRGEATPSPVSGQVDTTYASGGRFTATVPGYRGGLSSMRRVALASDGSVYLAGPTISRLDSAGNLDQGYAVNLPSSGPLLDETGHLYVRTAAGIAKLDRAGNLVASFGTNGQAMAPWLVDDGGVFARDGSGNLVLAGPSAEGATMVAKFDREGRLVASFGDAGKLVLAVPGLSRPIAAVVAFDASGNVYIGGRTGTAYVVKLDGDGLPVTEFGVDGVWIAPPICQSRLTNALAFDAAGYLYVACAQVIFKLDALANPEPSFGLLGASTALRGEEVTSLLIAENGEIFAAGVASAQLPCTDFVVARLDVRGAAVPGFGVEGRVVLHVDAQDVSTNVAMDGAGRLYVSGASIHVCTIIRPISQSTVSVFRLR